MTNEQINTALYWKLQAEHESFKNWLMTQPPAVILEHAYKYAMMEDILLVFENNNLPTAHAKALMHGSGHLDRILDAWQEDGTGHMGSMWEKAQEYAKDAADRSAKNQGKGR